MTNTTEENLVIVILTKAFLDIRSLTTVTQLHLRDTLTHHSKLGALQTEASDSTDAQQNLVKQLTLIAKQELNE